MKAYHITEKENADKIKATGFNLDFSGTRGGNLLGDGIYFCSSKADCEMWDHRIGFFNPEIIEIDIEAANIQNKLDRDDCIAWLIENEWMDFGRMPTEKMKALPMYDKYTSDAIGYLKTEYAKVKGYDGIIQGDENIIVWNLKTITIGG